MNFRLSRHAQEEMQRRDIPLILVESVLNNPQQIVSEREDRKAYQSQIDFGSDQVFLLRVIVADDFALRLSSQFTELAESINTGVSHENYL